MERDRGRGRGCRRATSAAGPGGSQTRQRLCLLQRSCFLFSLIQSPSLAAVAQVETLATAAAAAACAAAAGHQGGSLPSLTPCCPPERPRGKTRHAPPQRDDAARMHGSGDSRHRIPRRLVAHRSGSPSYRRPTQTGCGAGETCNDNIVLAVPPPSLLVGTCCMSVQ